jgi:hypothetical protein
MALPASKRCFLCDLSTGNFLANSLETVRLMGVAVHVEPTVDPVEYPGDGVTSNNDYRNLMLLRLDDGTATMDILTPDYMIQKLDLQLGQTLECIAWLRQRGTIKRWYAQSMAIVVDPHAEILRWLELSFRPKPNESMEYGYPTIQRNAAEALRLITVQATHDSDGVSLNDLALVMRLPPETMQEMLVTLQLEGQIYQNHLGNYVPL